MKLSESILDQEIQSKDISSVSPRLAVPGPAPPGFISGVEAGAGERAYSLADYRGRFLVILFYPADWEAGDLLEAFSLQQERLAGAGAALVACSTDNTKAAA